MNREIKFRTWDKLLKEFAEWTNRDPFFCTSHGQIFFWERTKKENGSYGGDIILEDFGDRFVLQQSTGLKDTKGREIYEGDLLARPLHSLPTYFEVYWNGASAKFNTAVHYKHNKMIATYPIVADDLCNVEVVGNIFENPELLQTKRRCSTN